MRALMKHEFALAVPRADDRGEHVRWCIGWLDH
jgi:hypothetical protein